MNKHTLSIKRVLGTQNTIRLSYIYDHDFITWGVGWGDGIYEFYF